MARILCHHFEDFVDSGGKNWIMVLIAPQGLCLLLNAFVFRVLLRWDKFPFSTGAGTVSLNILSDMQSSFSFF